jgi:glycosyltransferase involved in cell wall biosynthesis
MLREALASVLMQADVPIEVVVVDDGSADGTARFLAGVGDDRLVVVRHERPLGVGAARNAGLARASGEWVGFVDDDDLWAPSKAREQLVAMTAAGAAWSCTGAVIVDDDLRVSAERRPAWRGDVAGIALRHYPVPGGASNVIARAEMVRAVGGFDERLALMADWDLVIRLAARSPLVTVDRPLMAYRRHSARMSRGGSLAWRELDTIHAKYAAERARRGILPRYESCREWIADGEMRAGLRLSPALILARLALEERSPRRLARAALIPLPGNRLRSRDAQVAARVAAPWREEAEAWLAPLATIAATDGLSPRSRSTAPGPSR